VDRKSERREKIAEALERVAKGIIKEIYAMGDFTSGTSHYDVMKLVRGDWLKLIRTLEMLEEKQERVLEAAAKEMTQKLRGKRTTQGDVSGIVQKVVIELGYEEEAEVTLIIKTEDGKIVKSLIKDY